MHVTKIGVHGESLGGLVACHLARKAKIDYLCADRTFSSLVNVARYGFGKYLALLYRIVTRWDDDTSENFVEAPCYKIIAFDPKDEVISLLASLRYKITQRVIERAQNSTSDDPKSNGVLQSFIVSFNSDATNK